MPEQAHGIIIVGSGRGCMFARMLHQDLARHVVAMAEIDPQRRVALRRQLDEWGMAHVRIHANITRALQVHPRAQADVVFVMTPEASHLDIFRQAVRTGCHVYLEKPLATTRRDVLNIARLAYTTDKTIQVGFVLRCALYYRRIKEIIDSGALGRLVMIEFQERLSLRHGAAYCRNWRRKVANTGGFLNEKCSHDLDLIAWFKERQAGPVAVYSCAGRHYTPRRDTPVSCNRCRKPVCPWRLTGQRCVFHTDKDVHDHQSVVIRFSDDTQAVFTLNAFSGRPGRSLRLSGTDGYLEGDLEQGVILMREYWKDKYLRDESIAGSDGHGGGDMAIVADFIESVEQHQRPLVNIKDGVRASLLAFAAEAAARSGRAVPYRCPDPGALRFQWQATKVKARHVVIKTQRDRHGLKLAVGNPTRWPITATIHLRGVSMAHGKHAITLRLSPFECREIAARGSRVLLVAAEGLPAPEAAELIKREAADHLRRYSRLRRIKDSVLAAILCEIAPEMSVAVLRAGMRTMHLAWKSKDYLTVCRQVSGWRMQKIERMLRILERPAKPPARGAPLRINCASNAPYRAPDGTLWLADQPWLVGLMPWGHIAGATVDRGNIPIHGARLPQLYQTERFGATGYRFRLPVGSYRVRLHFAETYNPDAGLRRFDVVIQNQMSIRNLDVAEEAGGSYRALVKTVPVQVTDGLLRIDFRPASQMEINAIEVLPS